MNLLEFWCSVSGTTHANALKRLKRCQLQRPNARYIPATPARVEHGWRQLTSSVFFYAKDLQREEPNENRKPERVSAAGLF
jgi:hypothetical protein